MSKKTKQRTNTTHPATAGTNTTPPAALSQKLQTKQLGALDARTEDKVKDAVLTKNPDLKAADRDKLTVQFVGVRNRATKAKITHSELTGTIKVTFSVKKALNTFTKLTTKKITVTQADVTNPTQDTLNKFLKKAGSLTVNNDVTITFNDVDNKKTATITAAPNSTKAQGSVVFTNVKVAQPTAPVVDANATTAPTATTDNRQPNADTNATQQSNGDTNASGQLNAGKTSQADNKLADETPADNKVDSKPSEEAAAQKVTDETVKKPTDEAGTKKVADETVKKPADDEKPTDEAGAQKAKESEAQTAKPVVTAPEAEAQKAKELEAQKTKEAETQKIEGNTETQKTEGNTETKNPAVTEETSKPEENKGNTETKTTDETVKVADEAETKKPKDDEKLADSQDKVETDSKAEVKESDKKQEEKSSLAGLWWTLGIVLTFLSLGSGYYCFQKVKK
ncbi:hypothetical protein [Candidatus Phytoplasma solani]|uniref:Variable membrane protein n=1 Tax=Candidatus Phytoplasma solani TaxID=69896 RepID=A0A421NUB7_9MOLU|nr:hypothetical protein [Candidatus Phytoplasma solani]RMI87621.1 hypothetical protein PSSA1_v1c6780 [Candidatus Phytoplasma solani]